MVLSSDPDYFEAYKASSSYKSTNVLCNLAKTTSRDTKNIFPLLDKNYSRFKEGKMNKSLSFFDTLPFAST
jgi:hypothetical protein